MKQSEINKIKAEALNELADQLEDIGAPNYLDAAIRTHQAVVNGIRRRAVKYLEMGE